MRCLGDFPHRELPHILWGTLGLRWGQQRGGNEVSEVRGSTEQGGRVVLQELPGQAATSVWPLIIKIHFTYLEPLNADIWSLLVLNASEGNAGLFFFWVTVEKGLILLTGRLSDLRSPWVNLSLCFICGRKVHKWENSQVLGRMKFLKPVFVVILPVLNQSLLRHEQSGEFTNEH